MPTNYATLVYDIATKILSQRHRDNSTNGNGQSDSRVNLKTSFNNGVEDSESSRGHLVDKERAPKDRSRPRSNEQSSNEAGDSMTDSSIKLQHNNKLSESSGQKRIALSPPLSSSVVYPSSPERYNNDSKRATQTVPSPSERHNALYNRRDNPDRHYKTTNNNREDGEIAESDDEKEDGEVSSVFEFKYVGYYELEKNRYTY